MNTGVLAIVMIFAIPIVAIIGGIFLSALKILKGEGSSGKMTAEETRLIQEVHRGLQKMEDRIEALETLLMDRAEQESAGRRKD